MRKSPTVEEQPEVIIDRWHLAFVEGEYRLVGLNMTAGRLTTPLVELDLAARRAVTASGRVYHLRGEPDAGTSAAVLKVFAEGMGLSSTDYALADASEAVLSHAPAGRWQ